MAWDDDCWRVLEGRWVHGFATLLAEEQEAIALYWLVAETMNGTAEQFFKNSSGELANLAMAGLRRLQLPQTYSALTAVMAHFGSTYPTDHELRRQQMRVIQADPQAASDFVQALDRATAVILAYEERCDEVAVKGLRPRYVAAGWL